MSESLVLSRSALIRGLFAAIAVSSCAPPSSDAGDTFSPSDASTVDENPNSTASGPWVIISPLDEGGPLHAPEFCDWATSGDLLVFGRVTAIELVDYPLIQGTQWEWVEPPCGTFSNGHALRVTIEPLNVMRGTVNGPLTFSLGATHRVYLNPAPILDDEGNLTWFHRENWPLSDQSEWNVGSEIGVLLRYLPAHSIYSLMGEAVFVEVPDAGVRFDPHIFPIEAGPPIGAEGWSVAQLADEVTNCPSPASEGGEVRRRHYWGYWGPGIDNRQPPTQYIAAYCPHPDELPQP